MCNVNTKYSSCYKETCDSQSTDKLGFSPRPTTAPRIPHPPDSKYHKLSLESFLLVKTRFLSVSQRNPPPFCPTPETQSSLFEINHYHPEKGTQQQTLRHLNQTQTLQMARLVRSAEQWQMEIDPVKYGVRHFEGGRTNKAMEYTMNSGMLGQRTRGTGCMSINP